MRRNEIPRLTKGPSLKVRFATGLAVLTMTALLGSGVASAAIRPGAYCLRKQLPDGDFRADARVQRKPGQTWFRFSDYSFVNDHIVGTGTVLLREKSPNLFTFSFTDNWGDPGVGTVETRGSGIQVIIDRADPSKNTGHDTGINYGTFDLRPAPCREAR